MSRGFSFVVAVAWRALLRCAGADSGHIQQPDYSADPLVEEERKCDDVVDD